MQKGQVINWTLKKMYGKILVTKVISNTSCILQIDRCTDRRTFERIGWYLLYCNEKSY